MSIQNKVEFVNWTPKVTNSIQWELLPAPPFLFPAPPKKSNRLKYPSPGTLSLCQENPSHCLHNHHRCTPPPLTP